MYRGKTEPNFESFTAAARSGNSNSMVAFNPGVITPIINYTEYEDYTAGEINSILPLGNPRWDDVKIKIVDGKINGKQYHILTFAGSDWGQGSPRFTPEFIKACTNHINSQGGVISWDIPCLSTGKIPQEYVELLKVLPQ